MSVVSRQLSVVSCQLSVVSRQSSVRSAQRAVVFTMHILKLDQVQFGYSAGFRISDLTLEVEARCMMGLVGPNGSGKSTVLRLMSGLLTPGSGQVLFDNRPLRLYSRRDFARRLAVVSHERTFEFPFTVRDIVTMGRFSHSSAGEANEDQVIEEALARTGTLGLAERSITQLSSGERQLVLIARAIAQEPAVMLLDEPDAHLDVHHQLRVFRLLRELNEERSITIVLVSHDLSATASFCKTLVLMSRGAIIKTGDPREVIVPEILETVYGEKVTVAENPLDGMPLVLVTTGVRAGGFSKGSPRDRNT